MPGGIGIPAVSLHAVIERGGQQVFEHVLVLAEQARVDRDPLDGVLAGHRDLDESCTRLSFDLDRRELVLRLLEVVLHRLRLLHQAGELALHHVVLLLETWPGTLPPSAA